MHASQYYYKCNVSADIKKNKNNLKNKLDQIKTFLNTLGKEITEHHQKRS